jgi:hypothetical protein
MQLCQDWTLLHLTTSSAIFRQDNLKLKSPNNSTLNREQLKIALELVGNALLLQTKNGIFRCPNISILSVPTAELENILDETIWVEILSKGQSCLLCNTYRSPCTDIDYWTRLTYAIELALQINENIIITGDLNSNLLCSNNNELIDLVNIFNLKNVIDKPTRISGNTSTLLDPIILSDTLNCNYSDVLKIPRHISDHDAAIAFIKCPKAISNSFTRDIWLYDQTNFVRFNQMLTDINWNEKLCNFDAVGDMCE